ncbi:hypothetical protein MMC27_007224 [Xylographa pallens]|nr:hypothetical protein [Xylographa pallens]
MASTLNCSTRPLALNLMDITTITNPPLHPRQPFALQPATVPPRPDPPAPTHPLALPDSYTPSTRTYRSPSASLTSSPSTNLAPSPLTHPRPSPSSSPPPKRRLTTPNACTGCKRAKAKCSGVQPACSRCARRGEGLACHYDADTRSQKEAMVEEIRDLRQRYKRAERILVAVGGEEGEGTVRALRRGDSYEEIERELGERRSGEGRPLEGRPRDGGGGGGGGDSG